MDEAFQQRFGKIVVEPAGCRLLVVEPAKIGARAFDLLMALIERRDRVVFKDELLDLVWPNVTVEEGNLQVQIATLRRLLGAGAIATVPGRGYQFVASEAALQTSDKRPAPEPEPSDAGLGAISAPGRARLAKCGLACGVCGRAACRLPANRAWLRCPSST